MVAPSLELVDDSHFYISGNVVVHPSAAIAPGVMLQADPGSQLIVAAGVSIGMGSILHAYQGPLIIEAGATLGSGVLIVGTGRIGSQACIGSMTTILNGSIEPKQLVAAGSLIGDDSRTVTVLEAEVEEPVVTNPIPVAPPAAPPAAKPEPPAASPPPSTPQSTTVIYGQAYLERMLITMFPQRRFSGPSPPASDSNSNSGSEPGAAG